MVGQPYVKLRLAKRSQTTALGLVDPTTRRYAIGTRRTQSLTRKGISGGRSGVSSATGASVAARLSFTTHLPPVSERTFERTVDDNDFDKEKPRPPLGNLAAHTNKKHGDAAAAAVTAADDAAAADATRPQTSQMLASAKLMEKYLEEGKLNPKREPTQRGFLQVFAAWLVEDNLPFTTGESPGLARLFAYMGSKFMLPRDTTVRNTVAQIFTQLHAEVVTELVVRLLLLFVFSSI